MEHDIWEEFQDLNYKVDLILEKLGITKEAEQPKAENPNLELARKFEEMANQFRTQAQPEPQPGTPMPEPPKSKPVYEDEDN